MASTLVTIFPGPDNAFRVRELAPGCETQTLGWFSDWDIAVEFIRENCQQDTPCAPDEFRAAYRECKEGTAL